MPYLPRDLPYGYKPKTRKEKRVLRRIFELYVTNLENSYPPAAEFARRANPLLDKEGLLIYSFYQNYQNNNIHFESK